MPAPTVSDNLCGLGFAGPAALYMEETFVHLSPPSDLSEFPVTSEDGTTTQTLADWTQDILDLQPFTALVDAPLGATLVAADSGKTYTNQGAGAIAPFVLPGASSGLRYSFMVQNVNGVRVTAATGDTIRVITQVSAAAGKVESTMIGSTVTMIALNGTEWFALSALGSWAVT